MEAISREQFNKDGLIITSEFGDMTGQKMQYRSGSHFPDGDDLRGALDNLVETANEAFGEAGANYVLHDSNYGTGRYCNDLVTIKGTVVFAEPKNK